MLVPVHDDDEDVEDHGMPPANALKGGNGRGKGRSKGDGRGKARATGVGKGRSGAGAERGRSGRVRTHEIGL